MNRDAAAEACQILNLDDKRVTSIGFALEAMGCVRVRVEFVVDDDTLRQLVAALA